MYLKKLFFLILLVVILCTLLIFIFWQLPSNLQNLRDGLIAEIVGGGILSAIVAAIFFYLQEDDEYYTGKKKADAFFKDRLLLDLSEAFDRHNSDWNFAGLQFFYFDGSRINSLFDIYKANFEQINNYDAYFPENKLISVYKQFYREVRKGYVLGEQLERHLYQLVREGHHSRGITDGNDIITRMYIRAKIYTQMKEEEIQKYLNWKTTPRYVSEIFVEARNNKEISAMILKIIKMRKSLINNEHEIKKLIIKSS